MPELEIELTDKEVAILIDALYTAETVQRYSETMTNIDCADQTLYLNKKLQKALGK